MLHLLQGLFETHSRHVSGLELEGMGMDEPEVAEDPYEVRETDDVDNSYQVKWGTGDERVLMHVLAKSLKMCST